MKNLFLGMLVFFGGCSNNGVATDVTEQTHKSELHTFVVEPIIEGLEHPWGMTFISDHQLLVTERSGQLSLIDLPGKRVEPVSNVPVVVARGQGGLLDVRTHPQFVDNQLIYLSYVAAKAGHGGVGTEVARARLQVSKDLSSASLEDTKVLFKGTPKSNGTRHFGGRLAVNDQHVYLSRGDRGEREWAQERRNSWGAMIRMTHEGVAAGATKHSYVYSYGHRNPQGLAWHPLGQLWSHEHGPQGGDEINPLEAGVNYGWPLATFGEEYVTGIDIGKTSIPGMRDPLYHWAPSIAPSGMTFYSGAAFEQWQGDLFVGSLKFQKIVRLRLNDDKVVHSEDLLTKKLGRIRDIQQGPDGYLYVLIDASNGMLARLRPADSSPDALGSIRLRHK